MFTNRSKYTKGFTLIELMVVISVIGVLSSVALFGFQEVREQARDKTRMADLKQLQVALESYRQTYGEYPEQGCADTWATAEVTTAADICTAADYIAGTVAEPFVPNFISQLPTDPRPIDIDTGDTENIGYMYQVAPDGSAYKLIAFRTVETEQVLDFNNSLARCPFGCGSPECPNAGPDSRTYGVYGIAPNSTVADLLCW